MTTEAVCEQCTSGFDISEIERKLLQKLELSIGEGSYALPLPRKCPQCREQLRLPFRNEWNLFRRKCDWTEKELISVYPKVCEFTVVDPAVWWSDEYDPLRYGREFDFSRTFFEQFGELNVAVPKAALQNVKSENSEFTNYAAENKNCYLCVGAAGNEDCYYSYRIMRSKNVCDSYDLVSCERCYGCLHGLNLYGCVDSINCSNSSNLIACENCQGCKDCAGSADLQNRQYCLFNEQLTESEYREAVGAEGRESLAEKRRKSARLSYNTNCEDSSGEQLLNCSRCTSCFSLKNSQDCLYVGTGSESRDCSDCTFADLNELVHNSIVARECYRVQFGAFVYSSSESAYLMNCYNSQNCFGCSGLKRQTNCILNLQYTPREYAEVLPKIVDHMRATGEWGQFFSSSLAPFAYNMSIAQEYYPESPERVRALGFSWQAPESDRGDKTQSSATSAANVIRCSVMNKPFLVTEQERILYAELGVALPAECPEVRRERRMSRVRRAIRHYTS